MQDDARKALACLASEAINTKDLTLLDAHPGFWETRQVFPYLFIGFPDIQDTVEQQTCDGEWVTTRTTMRGTHTGPFMGLAASGKAVTMMTISLDQIIDGKVVEHFGMADWASALSMIGLIPPAPSDPKK
ncbi:ester cyclase [Ktedonosporobacter rubrisoli]|nr:ester cyclase [Ktedonosporobacter rubrisoli]